MSNERTLPHGVMEGKGAYNKYAKYRLGAALWPCPYWKERLRTWRWIPRKYRWS